MDEIVIKIDWTQINRPKIYRQLTKRFYGAAPRFIIFAASMAILILSFTALWLAFGRSFFPRYGTNYFLPLLIAAIGMRLLNDHWRKKLLCKMDSAPIRQGIRKVHLTPQGIACPSCLIIGSIEWSEITDVVEQQDMVLLLFSPIEYIPLPDSGLPDGKTRTDLLKQITKWRTA